MNIAELLNDAGIHVYEEGSHHHVTTGWIGIDCPYCPSNKARLGIPLARPVVASCWTCGAHSTYDVLVQLGGSKLAKRLKEVDFEDVVPKVRRGKFSPPDSIRDLTKKHDAFLLGRGISPEYVEKVWGVRGIGLAAKYAWSLYIPITLDGETVSFTTRRIMSMPDTRWSVPYQTAEYDDEAISAKDVLYGGDLARRGVVVCEGPIDAWRIGNGGTCTFGLVYSRAQVLQMSRFPKVVVCFDNEPEAQKVARELCDDLAAFPIEVHNAVCETGKDPSRSTEREVEQLRRMIR